MARVLEFVGEINCARRLRQAETSELSQEMKSNSYPLSRMKQDK